MNIGFVSTWFERGAAYVTKAYIDILQKGNNTFVYARGGEQKGRGNKDWDFDYVTWAPSLQGTHIKYYHIKKWIMQNDIEVLFFNEQHEMDIVYKIKKKFPNLKIGSYIDYYKEHTVKEFDLYDFLICNTKRHYSVFKNHPQSYYVPWGTDVELFNDKNDRKNKELVFFHSAGMSNRKGTTSVIESFIEGKLFVESKLIIHTQKALNFDYKYLKQFNIEVIEKTVSAPGLYYLGDVYVYPTMLDGLGLTLYEALASGMPVITTNNAPMNEVINDNVGQLVDVEYFRTRADAYYWPLSIVNKKSLIKSMKFYIENYQYISSYKEKARNEALEKWNWKSRSDEVRWIFKNTEVVVKNPSKKILRNKPIAEKITDLYASSHTFSLLKKMK